VREAVTRLMIWRYVTLWRNAIINCSELSRNANITADSQKLYAELVQKDTDK
jgi:hypothetical protein